MKKGILFAGVALTLAFAGCDDGSAKITELQAELDAAKMKADSLSLVAQEELSTLTTTWQYKVDSLQYVIDSITAPKGTTVTKPKPKPAPTPEPTKTEEPKKDNKLDVGTDSGKKLDVGTNKTEEDKGNSGKLKVKP